jgi:predicted GNAT family acetyltransferase
VAKDDLASNPRECSSRGSRFFSCAGWRLDALTTSHGLRNMDQQMTRRAYFHSEDLSGSNIDELLELVKLTKPGPFGSRTLEMGCYLGIRQNGHLVAMAGEGLRLPGYTEISAVYRHPDHRGRGYATSLVAALVRKITERNEIPFLHVATENVGAIRHYEKPGFATRRIITLAIVKRGASSADNAATSPNS